MLGQSAPVSSLVEFGDNLRALAARVAELERLAGVPQFVGGVTTATTDADGIVIVTHGLSFTPSGVVASPRSTNHSQHIVNNIGATTFRYRAFTAAGTPAASASITFQWIAFR